MGADLMKRMELLARMVRDPRLTRGDVAAAFVLLYRHFNAESGRCDPSYGTIAKGSGLSRRHAIKCAHHLRDLGYFHIEAGRGTVGKFGPTSSFIPIFEVDTQCATEHPVKPGTLGEVVMPRTPGELEGPGGSVLGNTQTSNLEPVSNRAASKAAPKFAFEGKVIRLNEADLQKLSEAYHSIPDILAELAGYDRWLSANLPNKERKQWFLRLHNRMNAIHQKRVAEGQRPGGNRNLNESW